MHMRAVGWFVSLYLMSAVDEKDELTLESLAEQHGVAVVVVDENSIEVASANNNSICSQLY